MVPGTGIEPARESPRRSKHRMSTIPSTRRLFSPDNRTFFYPIALNAVRILVRIVFPSAGNHLEPLGFSSSIIRLCPACGPVLRTFFGENLGFLLCPQLCTSATYRNLSITTGISGQSFSQASEFLRLSVQKRRGIIMILPKSKKRNLSLVALTGLMFGFCSPNFFRIIKAMEV